MIVKKNGNSWEQALQVIYIYRALTTCKPRIGLSDRPQMEHVGSAELRESWFDKIGHPFRGGWVKPERALIPAQLAFHLRTSLFGGPASLSSFGANGYFNASFEITIYLSFFFHWLRQPHFGLDYVHKLLTKYEVKMAGYQPSSLFTFLWTDTKSRSIKTQKENKANIQQSWPN